MLGPTIELPATPAYVATARLFAAAAARHFGVEEADVEDARLAVSEIVTASLVHAGGAATGAVEVSVAPPSDGIVTFRVGVPGRLPERAEDVEGLDGFADDERFAVRMTLRLIHELFADTMVEPIEPGRTVVAFSVPLPESSDPGEDAGPD